MVASNLVALSFTMVIITFSTIMEKNLPDFENFLHIRDLFYPIFVVM